MSADLIDGEWPVRLGRYREEKLIRELEDLERENESLRLKIKDLATEGMLLRSSRSWRSTRLLREVADWMRFTVRSFQVRDSQNG